MTQMGHFSCLYKIYAILPIMSPATLTIELLNGSQGEANARALLAPANFEDWRAASRCLLRLAPNAELWEAFSQFFPHLLVALSNAAGPDRVLANLERLVGRMDNPLTFFRYLARNPRAVEILVTLFAGSQFLTEILLRNPAYFERLVEYKRMAVARSAEQLYSEAQNVIARYESPDEKLDALRRFQCWELLRIGTCDLLDLYDLPAVTRQLSNLADSLLRCCLKITALQSGATIEDLTVLAMGKLGGRELNYSSDIDLLFLSNQDPVLAQKVGERLIEALTRVTDEGFLYRVDMRLRPWGEVGPLVSTLEGYRAYLEKHARPWEKQALIKARVVAGNHAIGPSISIQYKTVPIRRYL